MNKLLKSDKFLFLVIFLGFASVFSMAWIVAGDIPNALILLALSFFSFVAAMAMIHFLAMLAIFLYYTFFKK